MADRIYFDLIKFGFGSIIEDLSILDMNQLWMYELNREGFTYEVKKSKNDTEHVVAPIFIWQEI